MSQKVPSEQFGGLEPKQVRAVESLLQGTTATAAAQAAGVNRRTLLRWQQSDYAFQAALNQDRHELREAVQLRLEKLAESAISVVEQALSKGDVRAALAVLRGLLFLGRGPVTIGSDDARALALQARIDESERRKLELIADLGAF